MWLQGYCCCMMYTRCAKYCSSSCFFLGGGTEYWLFHLESMLLCNRLEGELPAQMKESCHWPLELTQELEIRRIVQIWKVTLSTDISCDYNVAIQVLLLLQQLNVISAATVLKDSRKVQALSRESGQSLKLWASCRGRCSRDTNGHFKP